MSDPKKEHFQKLLDIVSTLRGEQGCPWDRKQTPVSMKPYLLEEAHELAEAIDKADPLEVKEEVGDLFFQLALIAEMYRERREFTVEDCLHSIITKMTRRHPHVFQDKKYSTAEELKAQWQEIKSKEKKSAADKTAGLDVPRSLPALSRAQRVVHRACRNGANAPDHDELISSLRDRVELLTCSMQEMERERIAENLGSLLMELMHVGRFFDLYCEDLLKKATDEFIGKQEKPSGGGGRAGNGD